MSKDCLMCPQCGQETMKKPDRFYRVFEKTRQPNGVCPCGHFYWEKNRPSTVLSTALVLYQKPFPKKILVARGDNSSRRKIIEEIVSVVPNLSSASVELLKDIRSFNRKRASHKRHKRYRG